MIGTYRLSFMDLENAAEDDVLYNEVLAAIATADEEDIVDYDPYKINEFGGHDDYSPGFDEKLPNYSGWTIRFRTGYCLEKEEDRTRSASCKLYLTIPDDWVTDKRHIDIVRYILLPYIHTYEGSTIFFENASTWATVLQNWLSSEFATSITEDIEYDIE